MLHIALKTMDISVVSWVHNCEDTIKELYDRVSQTMEKAGYSYEIILVNDRSSDRSWEIIKDLHKSDPHVKAINFSRHYGNSAGLQAGFDIAKGNLIFTISPTLENHPEELPKFVDLMNKSNLDMVVGYRRGKTKGRLFNKQFSRISHSLISWLIGNKVNDVTSPVRLINRSILNRMRLYGDQHAFLPALASLYGAHFGEIDIEHVKPKNKNYVYNRLKLHQAILDLIVIKFLLSISTPPFTVAPVRLFGGGGLISLGLGFVLGIYLTMDKIIYGHDIGGRPLLLLSALLIMVGSIFIVMGLLGELLVRIYFEGQNKMPYHIREILKS